MDGCSPNWVIPESEGCGNITMPSIIKKLELKPGDGGKYCVRINGEGEWIECDYDPVQKTVEIYF